jgi:hypothetical protein
MGGVFGDITLFCMFILCFSYRIISSIEFNDLNLDVKSCRDGVSLLKLIQDTRSKTEDRRSKTRS